MRSIIKVCAVSKSSLQREIVGPLHLPFVNSGFSHGGGGANAVGVCNIFYKTAMVESVMQVPV